MSFKNNNSRGAASTSSGPGGESGGRRGFTLLEILIAIAILAVVATVVYASFGASIKMIERVDQEADLYREARFILSRLSEELAMAYRPKDGLTMETLFVGEDSTVDDRPQDALRFSALAHYRYLPNQPASDLSLIEYSLESDPEAEGWVLLHKKESNVYSLSGDRQEQFVIGEGIHGFNLRYFDGKTWRDRWNSQETQELPKVVEVELQFQEPEGGRRSFLS